MQAAAAAAAAVEGVVEYYSTVKTCVSIRYRVRGSQVHPNGAARIAN
jgi:hypothetical protein